MKADAANGGRLTADNANSSPGRHFRAWSLSGCLGLLALMFALPGGAAENTSAALDLRSLDEMDDVSAWRSLASDGAHASVHGAPGVDGGALVLEFDLANTAGYTAATRNLPTELPDDYELTFWLRGEAGRNHFEVKFVDETGFNVWWYRRANFQFTGDWQQLRIKKRQIEFAWGPTDDKVLRRFASIEFVLSAGAEGGKGNLWFDRLSLKPVVRQPISDRPTVAATSAAAGHGPERAMDGNEATVWRSAAGGQQVLTIDLRGMREFGGIEIDWAEQFAPRYSIETSSDGTHWTLARSITHGNGGRDSHLLPESEARYIRMNVADAGRPVAIRELHVRDLDFGASPNAFVQSLARNARRGCYPRGFLKEQSYWTIVGVDGDTEESMLSEDGALEVRRAGFSIEPFVRVGRTLVTWADVKTKHTLLESYLPVPEVEWQHANFRLSITALSGGEGDRTRTEAIYRLTNPTSRAQQLTFALVVRPFQVNPPAQFLNGAGGVTSVQDIEIADGVVLIDKQPSVRPATAPRGFTAVSFDADTPCEWLMAPPATPRVHDESGLASAALLYDVRLPAKGSYELRVDLPLHPAKHAAAVGALDVPRELSAWREKLNRVEIVVPKGSGALIDTLRTALAHVLINRDGAALQPGSRSYERSWIRDGAMTSEMLLRLGHEDVVKEFLRWYAPYQFANGKVPCCVDRRGADPVPENDSHGEFLFLIDTTYRYTGDEQLLRELWPAALKAVQYMDQLRLSERTAANQTPQTRALYGLMPASISHEGYSAKPMHSYWDNFWALAGYESAIRIARTLKRGEEMTRFIESRDEFRADLYRSLNHAMHQHKIDYLPGAAELGDFDATSTTIALSPVGELQMLPPTAVQRTFERYWEEFSKRRTDTSWGAYTPYEWRNLGAFIRLGWRERGLELIEYFMNDRRPATWNQWAEVVGRVPREERFIGDMPHGWVASDYGRSLLDMFAYERQADEALVLMAGVPKAWIEKDGFAVRRLRTPFGPLSYSLKVEKGRRVLEVEEIRMPNGGVAIAWPGGQPDAHQSIQRGSGRWIGDDLRINKLPFTVVFE